MELWRPIITKVEGKKPSNQKEARTLTNEVWYIEERLRLTTWEDSKTVSEQELWLHPERQLCNKKWWKEPWAVEKFNEEDSYGEILAITTEPTFTKFSIVCLFNDEGIYLSQRSNLKKTMYLLYQVPGGKCEKGETAR